MPIPDDTTYGAQRGDVCYDSTTQAFYTRATGAWRIQSTSYRRIIQPNQVASNFSNTATTRGQVYLTPFEIPQRMTIGKLYYVINAGSGTVRFAIYPDNGDTPTGAVKVWDSGNIGATAFRTTATVSYVATPGQYWLSATFSSSISKPYYGTNVLQTVFSSATFSYASDFVGIGGASYTKSTVLPSVCPAVSLNVPAAQIFFAMTVS